MSDINIKAICLGPDEFSEIFPFHFAFDDEFRIISVGPTLASKSPATRIGAKVEDCFTIRRPRARRSPLAVFKIRRPFS